jgi:hypothetical protein
MVMKTIKVTATVAKDGVLRIEVPVEIEPGEYDVAIEIEGGEPEMIEIGPLKLYPLDLSAWPPGSTFSRDEIYDDER